MSRLVTLYKLDRDSFPSTPWTPKPECGRDHEVEVCDDDDCYWTDHCTNYLTAGDDLPCPYGDKRLEPHWDAKNTQYCAFTRAQMNRRLQRWLSSSDPTGRCYYGGYNIRDKAWYLYHRTGQPYHRPFPGRLWILTVPRRLVIFGYTQTLIQGRKHYTKSEWQQYGHPVLTIPSR